ncbi:hypothetical protein LSH36_562g00010 [Paralvinella palmiformis]|uniref:Uncharacterized protein n=1 Tax=Paralvinella palmiformis TaxID=53620 RepID=A0AAD9J7E4_9ANNE|nr:hypothetical protein LSH36_562g00010 [Paralvinella palmiformis]
MECRILNLPCNCSVSGDPVISTFDHAILLIMREQKTLISRWAADPLEACKFQLRVVTQKEIGAIEGNIYIEWLGFGFNVFPGKNKKKMLRNVLIGQNLTHIKIRGHGYDGAEIYALPYTYADNGIYVHISSDDEIDLISTSATSTETTRWWECVATVTASVPMISELVRTRPVPQRLRRQMTSSLKYRTAARKENTKDSDMWVALRYKIHRKTWYTIRCID